MGDAACLLSDVIDYEIVVGDHITKRSQVAQVIQRLVLVHVPQRCTRVYTLSVALNSERRPVRSAFEGRLTLWRIQKLLGIPGGPHSLL